MKNSDLKVTFDFDGTLEKPHVQEFAKFLMDLGVDVWVVTTRYDALHNNGVWSNPENPDLWEVIDKLGIPHKKVVFTNMHWKATYLLGTKVVWHLDDNYKEFKYFKELKIKTLPIQVKSGMWRAKCLRLLNLIKEDFPKSIKNTCN